MEYLFVLAGAFATLFLIILISNKGKRTEHWILALLLLLIVVSCYYVFKLYHAEGKYYVPYFSEINFAIPILYGTLLWLYTKSLLKKSFNFGWQEGLHFIPFIMFLGYMIFPLLMGKPSEASEEMGYPFIKLIINPIYIAMTLTVLLSFRKELLQQLSYEDQMHHYWLSWVVGGGIALWIVACIGNIFNWINDYETTMLGDYFLIGFLAVLLFILAFVGFNRTQIFQATEKPELIELESKKKQTVAASPSNESNQLFNKLKLVMDNEKPFLDSKLSLHKLSSISNISANKLSTIINQCAEQNFYDFINTYRVNAVKESLQNDSLKTYSLLGIAEECGFNSKASFNRVFKKMEGMTPSEFVKVNNL